MILRPIQAIKHLTAAIVLLLVVLAGVEVWLRWTAVPEQLRISDRTVPEVQNLLTASGQRHHELRKSTQLMLKFPGAAGRAAHSVSFQTNAQGCRGSEMPTARTPGTYRILVLGDDSICGPAADEKYTVATRIRQLVSATSQTPVEVINAGVPGYCPLLSWMQFEQDLAELKPNLVILHFDMSDVADDMHYRRYFTPAPAIRTADAGTSSSSRSLTAPIPAACPHPSLVGAAGSKMTNAALESFLNHSAIASWAMGLSKNYVEQLRPNAAIVAPVDCPYAWITDSPPDLRTQVRHALAPIARLKESVRRNGGQLLVTTCPVLWQVLPSDDARELTRRFQISGVTPFTSRLPFEVLREYCQRLGVPCCDASEAFRSSDVRSRLFSRTTPMLSEYGMALYAREIVAFLTSSPPSNWAD